MAETQQMDQELYDEMEGMSAHAMLNHAAEKMDAWAGIPMPLEDFKLVCEPRYPFADIADVLTPEADAEAEKFYVPEGRVRNHWYSRRRQRHVWIVERDDGRIYAETLPKWTYVERLTYWLGTCGASLAWDVEAESEALGKLAELVRPHTMKMYMLTGTFLETSKRSRVTYLFRRLRPTVALTPIRRNVDEAGMQAIAVLCLHPIGYYAETWGGAMVPTDDVIAHLLMMRGDEHLFWRRANHHDPDSPGAGL